MMRTPTAQSLPKAIGVVHAGWISRSLNILQDPLGTGGYRAVRTPSAES